MHAGQHAESSWIWGNPQGTTWYGFDRSFNLILLFHSLRIFFDLWNISATALKLIFCNSVVSPSAKSRATIVMVWHWPNSHESFQSETSKMRAEIFSQTCWFNGNVGRYPHRRLFILRSSLVIGKCFKFVICRPLPFARQVSQDMRFNDQT